MAFLLNLQVQGVSGKNEQSTQTPWRGVSEVHRLHRLKASPKCPYHTRSNSSSVQGTLPIFFQF